MSGSACARLSAPASQIQLLYKQGSGVLGRQGLAADTPAGTTAPFDRGENRVTSPWLLRESGEAAGLSGGSFLPGTPQVQIPALQLVA